MPARREESMGMNETNILMKITRIGVSKAALAPLTDMSETRLGAGLLCTKPLPGDVLLKIDKILNTLIDVAEIIAPLKLPVTDPAALQILLRQYNDSGLEELRHGAAFAQMREDLASLRRL
jgi:hypothetical protein